MPPANRCGADPLGRSAIPFYAHPICMVQPPDPYLAARAARYAVARMMTTPPGILFTAFEVSGDEHAAPVIDELRRRRPDLPIFALGGPAMRAAGAQVIEETTHKAAMLAHAAGQIWEHRRRLARLQRWLADKPLAALVPVDSPAANWSICKLIRRRQPATRIVHLVAPQIWAWASWRIGRMKRLSDHVLCLLPFEESWFHQRGVPATFVGHPAFDAQTLARARGQHLDHPPAGSPRLVLLPGSRMSEIKANAPTMLAAWRQLRTRHGTLATVAALRDPAGADLFQAVARRCGIDPAQTGISVRSGVTDAALEWGQVVLAVSGTVTLHVAAHARPLVTLYNVPRWQWELVGRWVVGTRTFTLPNLIGRGLDLSPAVPEFVPHFGAVAPIVTAVQRLLDEPQARQPQLDLFGRIDQAFAGRSYAAAAAQRLLALLAAPR